MSTAYQDDWDDLDDFEADEPAQSVGKVDPATRAVIYLRVSSAGQVNTDYDPEGISIPAQRVACQRKADQLGLTVVDEYVEPGRSATEMTKRVAFQQMLSRVRQDKDVGTVIVYKLSRMARNRYDDAIVMADLRKRGIALISATEAVDDTPVGQLMHGILATFNEYQSRESGADIAYKMGQKAKNGGTLGRAPIGYLNVIDRSGFREIRTVALDPERADLVKLAFELYATGEYTLADLVEEMYDRGLRTRATVRRPEGPLHESNLHQILRDRYYLGKVSYQGEEYEGRHPALIDQELYARVQAVIEARSTGGNRRRVHHHFLKGMVFCGACHDRGVIQRLALQHNVTRHGNEYLYYFCRHKQTKQCSSPHTSVVRIEDALGRHYASLTFTEQFITDVREQITHIVADEGAATQLLKEQLAAELARLDAREGNLLDLAADNAMPVGRIRQKLRDITDQRDRIKVRLGGVQDELSHGVRLIEACLQLLARPEQLYLQCNNEQRRLLNQALFTRIYVHHQRDIEVELREPFASLQEVHQSYHQGRDDAPPTATSATPTESITDKKAAPTSGGGLLRAQLELFAKGMDPVAGCNTPYLVGDAEPCYISAFHVKRLASDLESVIAQLPPPDAPPRRREGAPIRRSIRELRDGELAGMITDYQAGASLTDLAAKYGYNRVGISGALKRAGIQLRRQGLATGQVDEAERLYAAGQSLVCISERLKVDAGTVRTRLIQRGVTMRPTSLPR